MRRLQKQHGVDPVTDLWLVRGTDIKLDDLELWSRTYELLASMLTGEYRLVDIATNLREVQGGLIPWTDTEFSSILGAIAKICAEKCSLALIGSTGRYFDMVPHASSPLIDPLWSCDQQQVRHFTARAGRSEKIAISQKYATELMPILRVCYENRGGAYNCAVCEKCLRTQIALVCQNPNVSLAQFDESLSSKAILKLKLPCDPKKRYVWSFWEELSELAHQSGRKDLAIACDAMMRRNKFACPIRNYRQKFRSILRNTVIGRWLLALRSQLRKIGNNPVH